MTPQLALDLAFKAMLTAGKVAGPLLATAVVVGILVNIIQTVTSIKDMSLTFVPKLLASAVVVGLTLPWMLQVMTFFFQETYMMFGVVSP